MTPAVTKQAAQKLVGKRIFALKKDGTVVSGKLMSIKGDRLILKSTAGNKAATKAILPLVLFDLLAIGTGPFAYGPYGGYGYDGYGYPGYFW